MAAREVALVEIKAINAEVKERYGSPRIHQELKKRGFKTSLNNIDKIMLPQTAGGQVGKRPHPACGASHAGS